MRFPSSRAGQLLSCCLVDERSSLLSVSPCRPLTQEEIAQRRELARQRLLTRASEAPPNGDVPGNQLEDETPKQGTFFLGFSRVYSGTVRKGQKLYVLHPRYDPRTASLNKEEGGLPDHVEELVLGELYLLMGKELLPVDAVPAGNVLGVAGLECVIKSATVSSSLACPAFRAMSFAAAPIVKVAIEPVHASDMPALVRGMKLLNLSDPLVEIITQESGEHILSTAGEVHLQKCLDDLKKQYAKVELNVSAPIIPFRETVISPPKHDMVNEAISADNEVVAKNETDTTITIQTANKACTLQLQSVPLPAKVTALLEENSHLLSILSNPSSKEELKLNTEALSKLQELRDSLSAAFDSASQDDSLWEGAVDRMWAFGPRHTGPNVLLNAVSQYDRSCSVWRVLEPAAKRAPLRDYDNSIVYGFQLATLTGPLCEEPMHGVCLVLSEWSDITETTPSSPGADDTAAAVPQMADIYGPFSGQLISSMKEGCRRSFLAHPAGRLMAAMYSCDIVATAEVLGKVYAVLGRRNGRVLGEEMKEGSAAFAVKAVVPVAESFGFAGEIRKKTSGLASPQLVFSHWEVRVCVCVCVCVYVCVCECACVLLFGWKVSCKAV